MKQAFILHSLLAMAVDGQGERQVRLSRARARLLLERFR